MSHFASAPWCKFYGTTPAHLTYPKKTIYQMIRATCEKFPNLPAYEFMGKVTTYREFLQRIDLTARAYYAMGIRKGDRVTICMPNCPQAVDSFYALNRIGAVSNMIHPLSAAKEIAFYLNFSHSKAILTLDQFYPKVESIRGELQEPVTILVARIKDELKPLLAMGYALTQGRKLPKVPTRGEGLLHWDRFLAGGRRLKEPLPKLQGRAEDGASILYSGGTTGTTKGILLSNLNFNALALQTIAASGFAPIDGLKMLSVMPVFHGFGLGIGIHTALVGGACCILVPQFNVKTYAELLKKKKPHIIPGVPTLFEALLRADNLEGADLSFLKGRVLRRRQPVHRAEKEGGRIPHRPPCHGSDSPGLRPHRVRHGLLPDAQGVPPPGSIGVPFPDTYYKICRPGTTEEVDCNVEGEICLTGPSVMLGVRGTTRGDRQHPPPPHR